MNAQRTGRQQLPFIYVLSLSRNTLEHLPGSVTRFLALISYRLSFQVDYLAKYLFCPDVKINSYLGLPLKERPADEQNTAFFSYLKVAVFLRHK